MHDITLSAMVARTDTAWLEPMLRHLSRVHRQMVSQIEIFVDTAPLGPAFKDRPNVGTLEQLNDILDRLLKEDVIDRIREIDYCASVRQQTYLKHFGKDLGVAHDFRGYPIVGILSSLDYPQSDYILHVDADMLFYQSEEANWVEDAIALFDREPNAMFVSPRSGPPAADGVLKQRGTEYSEGDGFYSFDWFTSRKFLIDRKRFESFLPVAPIPISLKRLIWQKLTGKSSYWSWEYMVSKQLEGSKFFRADLNTEDCWTLHTPDHGNDFVKNLPLIITKVESGWYPMSQAGDYDLDLKNWIDG